MADKHTSADYQRAVGDLVSREVLYNVSFLVSELARHPDGGGDWCDDVLAVSVSDDWETPAWDEGWRVKADTNGDWFAAGSQGNPKDCTELSAETEAEAWRELCDLENIEPHQTEAYEHWIVSDWLARKLEAKGEMTGDICGLTIWGRCATGQAILLDGVICEIYDELHKADAAA